MLAIAPLVLSLALSAAAAVVPAAKRQGSDFAWCNALRATCESQITDKQDFTDFFAHDACLFGSTCPSDVVGPANGPLPQHRDVQGFLHAVVADIAGPDRETPSAEDLRVPDSIVQQISTDGQTITQQNFIDGFYHALDASNGPYPPSVDYVTAYFNNIRDWTAVCTGGIPFSNFKDWFVYSSYVISEQNCHLN